MRKIIFTLFILIVLGLCLQMEFVNASQPIYNKYFDEIPGQNKMGYNVLFDGEGEAQVLAKIDIWNYYGNEINNLVIEFPKNVRMINAIQKYSTEEKTCRTWNYNNGEKTDCQYWNTNYKHEFALAKYDVAETSNVKIYDFKFEKEVGELEKSTLILYYKVEGYVQEGLMNQFNFETLKIGQDVAQARVAIDVIDGLYLKSGKTKIGYQANSFDTVKGFGSIGAIESSSMLQLSNRIGMSGQLVKTGTGLDPWETFQVTGEYTQYWIVMHFWLMFGLFLGIVLSVLGMSFGFKQIKKTKDLVVKSAITGFCSTFILGILWTIAIIFLENLSDLIGRKYDDLFGVVIVLVMIIITLSLIILPSIYIGVTHKAKYGFITVGAQIVSMILLIIILAFVFVAIGTGF
ncbi:hypothetical protein HON01_09380 [Candidatus Woesearchaeota archaeon]|nr:hypothetical protein [Candidatus Woesearchaeota archaeon]